MHNAHMSDNYINQLSSLKESHPYLTEVLMRAEANRVEHLSSMAAGLRLAGLDEWLGYLRTLELAFQDTAKLNRIAFLVSRVRADYEAAAEATMSGMHAIVLDLMRDVMECFMLLREFRFDPTQIDRWITADQKALTGFFSPRELRKRHAERLNVLPQDLAESSDYKAHSRSLHISPSSFPWEKRGIVRKTDEGLLSDMCYWEMYSHAESIAVAITELISVLMPGDEIGPNVEKDLPRVAKAYERVSEMKQIFLALIEASKDDDAEEMA
jgi:hypothetical protein